MEAIKNYLHDLKEDESGMEMLQIAIIVALVAMLIGILAALFSAIWNKINDATGEVENMKVDPNQTNPYVNGGDGGGTREGVN